MTLRFGVAFLLMFLLLGCYEVNEEIVIDKNGSGTYTTKMDMSALLQMMQSMAGEEELAKNGLDKVIDTTILLGQMIDSAKNTTPEQKKLFARGTMKLQMNINENILKTDVNFPFQSYDDLQLLMSGSSTGGLTEVFKNIFAGKDSTQTSSSSPMQNEGLDQINNVFDVTITKNSISRKLNKARYQSLMERPELAQAKQMIGSGFEILYTTTIRLPRPVKNSDNSIISLSDDKKTVTIKYDLMKLFETPEKFSYAIVY